MSLGRCIPDLVAQGKLSPAKAAEAGELFTELERGYRRQFGSDAAAAMASEETVKRMAALAALKKRRTLLQLQAQKGALANMARYNGGKDGGPIDPRAAIALFDRDSRAPYSNVEARRKAIKGRAHAMIEGILSDHRKTLTGALRNPAQMVDVVKEAFGEASGNVAAKELADGWGRAADMLRQRFNAAGGDIGKLERWGLPQSHDANAVRIAGFAAWRDTIAPLLDRSRMIDGRTGMPFSDEGLELALREVHETIRTDGWSKVNPGSAGGPSMANRRSEHRFFHFRDAASWQAYNEAFGGSGTAFDAMMAHVEAMARDIAAMEILGPNPAATVRWTQDVIQKDAQLVGDDAGKASERAFASARTVGRLYEEYTGALKRPENRAIALGFSAIRSVQTAAKLGSATLSAVSDVGFQVATRKFNGLPAAGVLGDYAKLLNPASAEDRKLAVRLGLIAEEWSSMTASQNRYLAEELTGEVASRLAEGVLRMSGLSAFTQAGRWAFGMEFLGHITDMAGRSFDQLDPAFRGALERYGILNDAWDAIRATPMQEERGVQWIMPGNVADRTVGDRLLEMINTETDFAVPVPDLRTRALMNSVAPRGTIIGELARSALLFKSFGISVMLSHGRRALEQSGASKASYAAGLTIALTLGGGLALQLKEVAKGRDPQPMTDEGFWGAAMLQGGGFGPAGDLLGLVAENRTGSWARWAAGPVFQSAEDLTRAGKLVVTGDEKAAWAVFKAVRENTPGQSLWYGRLAFDRMVADQIQEQIDPNYRRAWRAMERRADDKGQEFFWELGEAAPDRAPDVAAIAEAAPRGD